MGNVAVIIACLGDGSTSEHCPSEISGSGYSVSGLGSAVLSASRMRVIASLSDTSFRE